MRFFLTVALILYMYFIPGPLQLLTGQASILDMIVQRTSYAIIAVMALAGVGVLLLQRQPRFLLPSAFVWPILVLVGAILISAAANPITPIGIVFGLLDYLRFPLLGLILIGLSRREFVILLLLIVACSLIQVPLAVVQFVSTNLRAGDDISGTLGSAGGQNMISVGLAYALMLALAFPGRRYWRPIAVSILMIVMAIIGDVGFLFVAPILVGAVYLVISVGTSRRLVLWGAGLAGATVLLFAAVSLLYSTSAIQGGMGTNDLLLAQGRESENLVDAITTRAQVLLVANGRSDTVTVVLLAVLDDAHSWINGFGVNAFYKGQVATLSGTPFASSPELLTRGQRVSALPWTETEIIDNFQSTAQFTRVFGEMGVIGLLAFLFLFLSLWNLGGHGIQASRRPEDVRLARAFRGMLVLYALVLPYYVNTWRLDVPSLTIWLMAAMIATPLLQQSSRYESPQFSPGA